MHRVHSQTTELYLICKKTYWLTDGGKVSNNNKIFQQKHNIFVQVKQLSYYLLSTTNSMKSVVIKCTKPNLKLRASKHAAYMCIPP